jgi:ankyrin repeat protein
LSGEDAAQQVNERTVLGLLSPYAGQRDFPIPSKGTELNDDEWNQIRDNIRKSGQEIIGSGHGFALIHAFARVGNAVGVRVLLQKGADIEAKTKEDETPLILAVTKYFSGLAEALIDKGANVNAKDKEGRTCLMLAAIGGKANEWMVKLLLRYGATAGIHEADNSGKTALDYAKDKAISKILKKATKSASSTSGPNTSVESRRWYQKRFRP